MVFAIVVSIMTAGAASAAIGFGATAGSTFATSTAATAATATTTATVATTAGLGNIALSAAMAGFTSSIASQLTMTGSLNWGSAFEGAAVAGITAGLTNGITYNSDSGIGFTTGSLTVGGPTSSLASLAGVNPLAGTSVSQASASTATTLETRALAMLGEAGISAGVGTAIEGGSLGTAFKDALTQEAAAAGAFAIGGAQLTLASDLGPVGGELAYLALHGALGCAAGAASGQGCGGGAIGGATSALIAPLVQSALYNGTQTVTYTDNGDGTITQTTSYSNTAFNAMTTSIAALSGGLAAGLAGANVRAGATWAENEAQNNTESTKSTTSSVVQSVLYGMMPWLPGNPLTQAVGSTITSTAQGVVSQIQANYGGQTPPSDPSNQLSGGSNGNPPNTGAAPVTPPVVACVPGAGCVVTPPLVSPGSPNSAPGNAILSSGNTGDEGGGATGQGSATNTSASGASVWSQAPTARGVTIESQLAQTEYSAANGWYQVGAENNGYFPLVDFQNGNTLVSLKTVDTTGTTWLPRMESVIDQLGSSGATVNGTSANMVLDVRVQPGGSAAAQSLVSYGASRGVTVTIKVYP
jgi:filamentous hemagglutinin